MLGPDRGAALPRPLGLAALALVSALLTAFFVYRGFPYDRLADRLEATLEKASGARVSIDALRPHLSIFGPGFEASAVRIDSPGAASLRLDRLALRPAWSLSWLQLAPAIHLEFEGPIGSVSGVLTVGTRQGWNGTLSGLDLASLPIGAIHPGTQLAGTVDADVALRMTDAGPAGHVELSAVSGRIVVPELPTPLPFDEIHADLDFGGETRMQIGTFRFQGPLFEAEATGTIGPAPTFENSPLDLSIHLVAQRQLLPSLRAAGIPVDNQGAVDLRITGTPSQPNLQ